MDFLEPVQQREQQPLDRFRRKALLAHQPLVQRLALDQRHDHVGGAVGFEEVVDTHNGRSAVEPRKRARLVEETLAAPGKLLGMIGRARQHGRAALAQRERGRQVLLDRDVAVERAMSRAR